MSESSTLYAVRKGSSIAGIDPDTKAITIVVLSRKPTTFGVEEFVVSRRVEAAGRRADDRFLDLARQIRDVLHIIPNAGASWCYLERPMVGPNRKGAIDMGQVVGMIRAELDRLDMPHSMVDPGVWKKALLGNGHATKEEIKEWSVRHLGMANDLKQDYYDAACIAAFGMKNVTL